MTSYVQVNIKNVDEKKLNSENFKQHSGGKTVTGDTCEDEDEVPMTVDVDGEYVLSCGVERGPISTFHTQLEHLHLGSHVQYCFVSHLHLFGHNTLFISML